MYVTFIVMLALGDMATSFGIFGISLTSVVIHIQRPKYVGYLNIKEAQSQINFGCKSCFHIEMLLFITFWFWQCHLLLNRPLNMADRFSQRLQRAFKGKYECTGIPGALLNKERENFHKIRRTNTEKTSGLFWKPSRDAWGSLLFYETRRGGPKVKFFGTGQKMCRNGWGKTLHWVNGYFIREKPFHFPMVFLW